MTSAAVAPIYKIRAALRERMRLPEHRASNVVPITDGLMLGWAGEEITARKTASARLAAVEDELADLRDLAAAIVSGEREVSPLERLLVFTKIESASGLVRQAFSALAVGSLALVLWVSITPDGGHDDLARGPRPVRVAKIVKPAKRTGARKDEVA